MIFQCSQKLSKGLETLQFKGVNLNQIRSIYPLKSPQPLLVNGKDMRVRKPFSLGS